MALTLRPTDEQELLIEKLCKHLEIKTASKLMFHLLENYINTENTITGLIDEKNANKYRYEKAEKVISDLNNSLTGVFNYD